RRRFPVERPHARRLALCTPARRFALQIPRCASDNSRRSHRHPASLPRFAGTAHRGAFGADDHDRAAYRPVRHHVPVGAAVERGGRRVLDEVGQKLLEAKLIDVTAMSKAQQQQKSMGGSLTANLVKIGAISEKDLTAFLSRLYNVPAADLSALEVDPACTRL